MALKIKETPTIYPENTQIWRQWLLDNHHSTSGVWLIYYRKNTGIPSITWSEAVDEALCFGWIDSTKKSIDHQMFMQFFSKRKPRSAWSKINKDKIEKLLECGKMTQAGIDCVELAKQNGSWNLVDAAEDLSVPDDLAAAFQAQPEAEIIFNGWSKSVRKSILQWLLIAKRPETRAKRILEIVEQSAQNRKPRY